MVNKEDFAALTARVEELEKLVQRVADLEKSNEAKDKKNKIS